MDQATLYVRRDPVPPAQLGSVRLAGYQVLDGILPAPVNPPSADLAQLRLLRPRRNWELPTFLPGFGAGPTLPFVRHPRRDLVVPSFAARELAFDLQIPVGTFLTLSDIGIPFSPDQCERTGWYGLAQLTTPDVVIPTLLDIAARLELEGPDSSLAHQLLQLMHLPHELARPLRTNLADRGVLFAPACLRWIAIELTVAYYGSEPVSVPTPHNELRGWLLSVIQPTTQLLRSVWLLQEGFSHNHERHAHGADDLFDTIAAYQYESAPTGRTFNDRIAREAERWTTPDRPDGLEEMRQDYQMSLFEEAGITSDEYYLAAWAWAAHVESRISGEAQAQQAAARALRALPSHVRTGFGAIARDQLVTSPEELAREARQLAGDAYTGVGSIPTSALPQLSTDRPVLRVEGKGLAYISCSGLLDRLLDAPWRFACPRDGRRPLRHVVGKLAEAQVSRDFERLSPRHWVVREDELRVLVPANERVGDFVVGYEDDCLVLEVTVSEQSPAVAAADRDAITRLLDRLTGKLSQARSTTHHLGRIAVARHRPRVMTSSYAIVAERPFTPSPILREELARRHGLRTSKLFLDFDELADLIDAGARGFSAPSLVRGWQQEPLERPLAAYLNEHVTGLLPAQSARSSMRVRPFERAAAAWSDAA